MPGCKDRLECRGARELSPAAALPIKVTGILPIGAPQSPLKPHSNSTSTSQEARHLHPTLRRRYPHRRAGDLQLSHGCYAGGTTHPANVPAPAAHPDGPIHRLREAAGRPGCLGCACACVEWQGWKVVCIEFVPATPASNGAISVYTSGPLAPTPSLPLRPSFYAFTHAPNARGRTHYHPPTPSCVCQALVTEAYQEVKDEAMRDAQKWGNSGDPDRGYQ